MAGFLPCEALRGDSNSDECGDRRSRWAAPGFQRVETSEKPVSKRIRGLEENPRVAIGDEKIGKAASLAARRSRWPSDQATIPGRWWQRGGAGAFNPEILLGGRRRRDTQGMADLGQPCSGQATKKGRRVDRLPHVRDCSCSALQERAGRCVSAL